MSSTNSHIMERRSPKSPLPSSPMPKSPLPQSPEFYEKYKSKCAHGLINFFHFRQSHSKKLISGRTLSKRHPVETKKIAGEGMPIKQQIKKTTAKVEHVQSDTELIGEQSTNHRKAMKSSRRPRRLSIYGCYDVTTMGHAKSVNEKSVVDSSKKLDSTEMEYTCSNQVQPKDERDCNSRSIHHGRHDQSKEMNCQVRMKETTEVFINQNLIDGNHLSADGANDQPKRFMDALEIFNSNKDLFIKLLQDPNSLLVKQIEDLQDSQAKKQQVKSFPEDKLSEHQKNNSRECDRSVCTQNFSYSDRYIAKGTGDSQPLETIVVLRSGSTSLQNFTDEISLDSPLVHCRLKNVQQSVKPSFFPLVKMKRKLMHAMGVSRKEHLVMLTDGAVHASKYDFQDMEKRVKTDTDIVERNQMDNVEIIKSSVREEAAPASESSHESSNFSSLRYSKQNKQDKYLETRVHLSEFAKNKNICLSKPKTWDGMSSLPENDFLPPISPRCKPEHDLFTPQMRFSPCSSYEMVNKNKWRNQSEKKTNLISPLQNVEALTWADDKSCDQLQITETKQSIPDELFPTVKADESIFSLENDSSPRGSTNIIGNKDIENSEEISPFCLPSKLVVSHNTDANESAYAAKTTAEYESSNILRQDLPAKNQTSLVSTSDCLSSTLSIQKVEGLDKAKERAEQPSPISVLEQFFKDDINIPSSPASASRCAELSVLPLQIGTEGDYLAPLVDSPLDLKINPSTSLEEHGSAFVYIGEALRASGFNLDDLSSKCHPLCHGQSCGDHKLVSDYFVEVLQEVYQCYLRSCPWLSFIKPKVRPVAMAENMVQQVMQYVDRNLLLQPPSQTLEHCVENDLNNSAPWLDVWIDAEDIVSMIVESVLEEMILETAIE